MKREKIMEHDNLYMTEDEKQSILNKSNGVCCHCGKPIFIGYQFSVDHFIPISKGGTNQFINLIPLCKDCNKEKNDSIRIPDDYIKFMKEKHLNEIRGLHESYIKSFEYIERNNLLANDVYEYTLPLRQDLSRFNKRKGKFHGNKFKVQRAYYYDLDRIYEYYVKYLKKYDSLDGKSFARQNIASWFMFGAIYYIEKGKDINAFVVVTVHDVEGYSDNEAIEVKHALGITPFFYYKNELNILMYRYLTLGLAETLLEEQGLHYIPLQLRFLANDNLIYKTPLGDQEVYPVSSSGRLMAQNYVVSNGSIDRDEALMNEGKYNKELEDFFQKFDNIENELKKFFSETMHIPVPEGIGDIWDTDL